MYQVTLIWFPFIGTSHEKKEPQQSNLEVNYVLTQTQHGHETSCISLYIFGILEMVNTDIRN